MVTLAFLYYLHVGSRDSQFLITRVLGLALFLTALSLIFRKQLTQIYARRIGQMAPDMSRWHTIASGAILGVLVSLSSVGAGAIGVTFFILLYPEMPISKIIGSDITHAVPLTLVAGLGHWAIGTVNGPLLFTLLLGSLPGIFLGSYLAPKLPKVAVRLTLASVLLFVCGKMLAY